MNLYDEAVVVKNLSGGMLGQCRMLAWVVTQPSGRQGWRGELRAVAGKPFDFAFDAVGQLVQVECKDGASAKVIVNQLSMGTQTDRCIFVGTGPAPRSK